MEARRRHLPELDGMRVLMVFIVSWYHFWQQSWLTPSIGRYSLDYLLRAGYMPVDGTILLSGFLLFLPYARTMMLGERVEADEWLTYIPIWLAVLLLVIEGVLHVLKQKRQERALQKNVENYQDRLE